MALPMLVVLLFFISAGSDFCSNRESGTYPDPEDCAGFIVCNIGKEHRQKCASPQLFQADTMNCDLPERVDCGTRPRRYGLTKRFYLIDRPQVHYSPYMRPATGANPGEVSLHEDIIKSNEGASLTICSQASYIIVHEAGLRCIERDFI